MTAETPLFTWFVLPLLIFTARIFDVTLGTFRIIFISRGMKYFSALVGFLEILIWLLAIGQIFKNLNNIACYFAYAGGFASGSFLGVYIVDKLSQGKAVIRIVTARDATKLIDYLRGMNFGVTTVAGQGAEGPVSIIFSVVKRKDLKDIIGAVQQYNPRAFYSVQDIKHVSDGIFPEPSSIMNIRFLETFRPFRKSK